MRQPFFGDVAGNGEASEYPPGAGARRGSAETCPLVARATEFRRKRSSPLSFEPKDSSSTPEQASLAGERPLPLERESPGIPPQSLGRPPPSESGLLRISPRALDQYRAVNTPGCKELELDELGEKEPEVDEPGHEESELDKSEREGPEKCKTGVDEPGEKMSIAVRVTHTPFTEAPHAMPRRTTSGGHRGGNVADGEGAHSDE